MTIWSRSPAAGEAPVSKIAKDFGISQSCLRDWLLAADVEDGRRDGPTRTELRIAIVTQIDRPTAVNAQPDSPPA